MATRRPPDNLRTPDTPKEIPKPMKEIPRVIKADEPGTATSAPRKSAAPRVRKTAAKAPVRVGISADDRRSMIAEGAYLRAERRGFAPGHEEEDWLAAEAEVDRLLKARHGGTSQ
jgi:hypothetical protein